MAVKNLGRALTVSFLFLSPFSPLLPLSFYLSFPFLLSFCLPFFFPLSFLSLRVKYRECKSVYVCRYKYMRGRESYVAQKSFKLIKGVFIGLGVVLGRCHTLSCIGTWIRVIYSLNRFALYESIHDSRFRVNRLKMTESIQSCR